MRQSGLGAHRSWPGPKARPVSSSSGSTPTRSAAGPAPGCDRRWPARDSRRPVVSCGPSACCPPGPRVSAPAASPCHRPSSPPRFRAKGDNGWKAKHRHGLETHSSPSPAPLPPATSTRNSLGILETNSEPERNRKILCLTPQPHLMKPPRGHPAIFAVAAMMTFGCIFVPIGGLGITSVVAEDGWFCVGGH
jgi:hypothetical protein